MSVSFAPTTDVRGVAVVLGASGGIGAALVAALEAAGRHDTVIGFSRRSDPPIDLMREDTLVAAADHAAARGPIRLVLVATGVLHDDVRGVKPEKSWCDLDADAMTRVLAVNAVGPALAMKHFLPRLATDGAVFAAISARVGSIEDNALGGWWSYRASKAALNQLVRTAAVELARKNLRAVCVALHPGTVATGLSSPFGKSGLEVQPPALAASRLLEVITHLDPSQSGGFFDHRGAPIAW